MHGNSSKGGVGLLAISIKDKDKISVFPDKTICSIDDDKFYHKDIAATITRVISDLGEEDHANTAIYGPWGTGKSSIGNLVKDAAEKERHVFIKISAWKYGNEPAALVRAFLLEASKKLGRKEVKKVTSELYQTVSQTEKDIPSVFKKTIIQGLKASFPFIFFLLLTIKIVRYFSGLDFPDYANIAMVSLIFSFAGSAFLAFYKVVISLSEVKITRVEEPKSSIEQYVSMFSEMIEHNEILRKKHRLIFFIDDVDRLPNNKVVKVLETIKAFIENKKCIFIVACEENVLQQAIRVKKKLNGDSSVEYLDKIFQVSISIPKLYDNDLLRYAEHLMKLHKDHIPYAELSDEELENIRIALVHDGIKTPRQVKIQLNDFTAAYQIAKLRKVKLILSNPSLLAKIIAIRNEWPEFYRKLEAYSYYLEDISDEGVQKEIVRILGINNVELNQEDIRKKNDFETKYGLAEDKLKGFITYLQRTRHIKVNKWLEPFLFLKNTPGDDEEAGGPMEREQIIRALENGDGQKLVELSSSENWLKRETHIVKFIIEKIKSSSPQIKLNAKCALSYIIPEIQNETLNSHRHEIIQLLVNPISFDEFAKDYLPEGIFRLLSVIEEQFKPTIFKYYIKNWQGLHDQSISLCILDNYRFGNKEIRKDIEEYLNETFKLDDEDKYTEALDNLRRYKEYLDEFQVDSINSMSSYVWKLATRIYSWHLETEGEFEEDAEREELEELDEIKASLKQVSYELIEVLWNKKERSKQDWEYLLNYIKQAEFNDKQQAIEKLIIPSLGEINEINDEDFISEAINELLLESDFKQYTIELQKLLMENICGTFTEKLSVFQREILIGLFILSVSSDTNEFAKSIVMNHNVFFKQFKKEVIISALDFYQNYFKNSPIDENGLEKLKQVLDFHVFLVQHFEIKENICLFIIEEIIRLGKLKTESMISRFVLQMLQILNELCKDQKDLALRLMRKWIKEYGSLNMDVETCVEAIRFNLLAGLEGGFFTSVILLKALEYSKDSFLIGLEYANLLYSIKPDDFNSIFSKWLVCYNRWISDEDFKEKANGLSRKFVDDNFAGSHKRFGRHLLKEIPQHQEYTDILIKNVWGSYNEGARQRLYRDTVNDGKNGRVSKLEEGLKIIFVLKEGPHQKEEIFKMFEDLLINNVLATDCLITALTYFRDFYSDRTTANSLLGRIDYIIKSILSKVDDIEGESEKTIVLKWLKEITENLDRPEPLKDRIQRKIDSLVA
ncbi:MAG: P-loop NTPase fold protein [Bacteroidales bacterium]|nr:P-loop NTPase fold protein [Bacteroidales bacterium]